jgi:hypothetical protein
MERFPLVISHLPVTKTKAPPVYRPTTNTIVSKMPPAFGYTANTINPKAPNVYRPITNVVAQMPSASKLQCQPVMPCSRNYAVQRVRSLTALSAEALTDQDLDAALALTKKREFPPATVALLRFIKQQRQQARAGTINKWLTWIGLAGAAAGLIYVGSKINWSGVAEVAKDNAVKTAEFLQNNTRIVSGPEGVGIQINLG